MLFLLFSNRSKIISSQDSEGESYVVDYIANLKVYGDVVHYSWTSEEEEDFDPEKEETSSEEDEVPLPNLGTCTLNLRSQVSLAKQRGLRSSLSLFASCRKISKIYAKRCWSLSGRSVN